MAKKSKSKISESQINEIIEILDSGEKNGSVEKTVAFFHDMPEEERRQYAKPIQNFCRERQNTRPGFPRGRLENLNPEEMKRLAQAIKSASNSIENWPKIARGVWHALLATSTPVEIEKNERSVARFLLFQPPHTENSLYRILGNRKPDWIASFLMARFEKSSGLGDLWNEYRKFYQAGLVPRLLMPSAIAGLYHFYQWHNCGTHDNPDERPGVDYFRRDKELLETELWLLFELPLPPLRMWAPQEPNDRWHDALKTLLDEKLLSRDRLLDAALDGIARNHLEWQENWILGLHEQLSVTQEERSVRIGKYIAILHSPRFTTAHFALENLVRLIKDGLVGEADLISILQAMPPLLLDKSKGRIKKVFSVFDLVLKNNNQLKSQVLPMLFEAITHENKDIQESAAKLLLKYFNPADESFARSVEDVLPILSPTVRAMFKDIVIANENKEKRNSPEIDESFLNSIPGKYRNLASIPELLEAIEAESDSLPAVKFNGMDIPRLYPENRLEPVSSIRELIDLMLKHLEHPFDFADFERIIDGIARLAENRDEEFERNTGPIRKWFQKNEFHWPWLNVIEAWANGEISTGLGFTSNAPEPFGAYRCWCNQIDRIYRMKRQHGAFQPLSTPTHRNGWIDPLVFVERLYTNIEKPDQYDIYDKITALLRLAPDNRAEALAKLDGFTTSQHGYCNAARYALGAPDVSIDMIEPEWSHGPIWAAASRARNPLADDRFIADRFPELGSGTALLPVCESLITREIDWSNVPFLPQAYSPTFAAPLKPESDHDLYPSVLLYEFRPPHGIWMSFFHLFDLWPGNPVPYHLAGISFLGAGMNSNSYDESKVQALVRLNDPDYPWSKETAMHLALGLVCSAPGAKTIATDIAIAMMNDGRFSDADFADAIVQLLPFSQKIEIPDSLPAHRQLRYRGTIDDYRLVPSRWAKCFTTIANESPLHAQYIRKIIEKFIPDIPAKDAGAFLDLLHDLCLESGETIEMPEARKFLADLKGSGKAAKAAKKLLDLQPSKVLRNERRRLAAQQSLQGRIERVKRWMDAELTIPTTK